MESNTWIHQQHNKEGKKMQYNHEENSEVSKSF
jgi:hypothetical protein